MIPLRTTASSPSVLKIARFGALVVLAACGAEATGSADATTNPAGTVTAGTVTPSAVVDRPLQPYQAELLEIAFRAASSMPLDPHIKNRSRAQQAVVDACFELDQPRRALAWADQIQNWRRGMGQADFAHYCASHGEAREAAESLVRATRFADELAQDPDGQAWRRDRIRARIAAVHILLGQEREATAFAADLADSETTGLDSLLATRMDAMAFDARVAELEQVFQDGGLEQVQSALAVCGVFFDRFYGDDERRTRMEELVKTAYAKLPVMIRIDRMAALVDVALGHADRENALRLVTEVRALVDSARWLPEDRLPIVARIATLRHRAGDVDGAHREVGTALEDYATAHDRIVDIYRASALRPLAEAAARMGDSDVALDAYRRAVEDGVHNVNSRPRADDLVATCISMARAGFEPTPELMSRIRQICDGLGDPW